MSTVAATFDPGRRAPTDPRVWVVEDEPRMRELLQRVLTNWGFDVTLARSAEEAARLPGAPPPDVTVLDLNLPGEGGMECFKRLRERFPAIQGIILTGFGSLAAAREAIHLDIVEFLTKPCHLGDLERALDRAIRRLATPGKPINPPEVVLDAPEEAADFAAPPTSGKTLEEVEREHILATLRRHGDNRTAAAIELGISRRTLYYKLDQYEKEGFLR